MKISISAIALVVCGAAFLPASVPAQAAPSAPTKVTVKIIAPRNGATVTGPVVIKLRATGVRIAPATVETPGTAHHHLFVDHDLNWINDTIPMGSPGIVHLARGQTEFVLDSLTPGVHRVIAVLADWRHIPLNPLVADTVTFTVK